MKYEFEIIFDSGEKINLESHDYNDSALPKNFIKFRDKNSSHVYCINPDHVSVLRVDKIAEK